MSHATPDPTPAPALPALGWDGSSAAHLPAEHRPARVSRVDRGWCDLLDGTGRRRASLSGAVLAAAAADPTRAPCVGDWAALREWPDGRVTLEAVLPRRTAFVRAAVAPGTSHGQVLAANVDVAVIVEGLLPEPDLGRVERLLALAWTSGARPVVVLTKADLVSDAEAVAEEVAAAAPGAPVHPVSAATGLGLDAVRGYCRPGLTLALLGPSGAGKSTLTNALLAEDRMPTRELRADGKGRHTTAHRELVALPGGGLVIDTPGLRSVGLTAGDEAVGLVFADVEDLAAGCRFGDCAHAGEPGCAVLAAVDSGELAERRLLSWRKLGREAAWMARRHDARLAAEERSRWKQRSAEVRRSGRIRP